MENLSPGTTSEACGNEKYYVNADGAFVDYVPCYRSKAGTGNAMGFAYWG